MKVLIVGSGGREHSLAEAFARDINKSDIYVAPGNGGIALDYKCLPLRSKEEIVKWCKENRPELVMVGPEQYLAEGLSNSLNAEGIPCVGPSQEAARIESSKIFAKTLMTKYHIPTASYVAFEDKDQALAYVRYMGTYPLVIKANGLAAGKGVIIADSQKEAENAIQNLGNKIVVEEYLKGWEVSLFVITDGKDYKTTIFSQDHKQLGENDTGPNTGGMGAFAPVKEAEHYREQIEKQIIAPTLEALNAEGCPYRGFLYCGLMITADGPKVLEFNCRLGDPETQAILPLLQTSFTDICYAILNNKVSDLELQWSPQSSVCVVLASQGYPGTFPTGFPIIIKSSIDSKIFYAGVENRDGQLITSGGRVLSLVALGKNLSEARRKVYKDVNKVDFNGKYFRRDISLRKNKL
ncbi:MAG: Phosphoribosylamine--glycine ligase [Candidatus Cloacimonetes bacterium ADurb.Bin211]|nr:MAG: Phosphoribosylamine--glycine ligase [Candidatus Cloacimonetes bacterium ADurb.Bin211]